MQDEFFGHIDPEANLFISADTCKYYTVDDYTSSFSDPNQYSLLNQNMQSFHAKKDQFEAFMAAVNQSFHSIVLTETWNKSNNLTLCNLEGYDSVHTYRTLPCPSRGGPGGGISVFAKSALYKLKKIDELSLCNPTIETCVAQLFHKELKDTVGHFIVGVYRPHTDSIENFTDSLQQILAHAILQNKTIILTGDFNINITGTRNTPIQNYLSLLNSLNFIPVVTKPTRFPSDNRSSHLPTTLDHIFINKIVQFNSAIFDYDLSDHCGTTLNCYLYGLQTNATENRHKITFRPYSENNFARLEHELLTTDWNIVLQSEEANDQFEAFFNHINRAYQKCFPRKTKFIGDKRFKNPWLTAQTFEKIKQKSHYYKLFKNGYITKRENNAFKNRLNKDIQRDKNNFNKKLFEDAKKNMKKSWEILKSLLGSKVDKKNASIIFDQVDTEPEMLNIVNNFNDFFSTIGSTLANDINDNDTSPIENATFNPNSFFLFSPTEAEISIIVSDLKMTKSHIDTLPVKLFKKLSYILLYPLQKVIDASFRTGIFPKHLKIARITPIHKNGEFSVPSNFRPISSLPYISKIYEKLMVNRLISFCVKFSILSDVQFGFQSGISTSDALFKITESIYKALDNKSHHISILLDIRKAFDCVDHIILLRKLHHYGIRGVPWKWFQSYLSDRQCYLEINSIKSNLNTFNTGVPQGSILGPILFLIYVNNLPQTTDILETQLFADDTIVSYSNNDLDLLKYSANNELLKILNWTVTNKLTLNASKTEILFVSNRADSSDNVNISLQNELKAPCNSCKYLGVHLDKNMTFSVHIDEVLNKISRHTGILFKIRNNLPTKARLDYYYAFIYPYLSYNVIFWGATYQTYLNPLIVQHKRTIRTICDAGFRDHTDPLFYKLGLLKFQDIYKYNLLIYMHKALARGEYALEHNVATRNNDGFMARTVRHQLTLTQHAVSFVGPTEWNKLPYSMRSVERLTLFKKALKAYLLNQYNSEPSHD